MAMTTIDDDRTGTASTAAWATALVEAVSEIEDRHGLGWISLALDTEPEEGLTADALRRVVGGLVDLAATCQRVSLPSDLTSSLWIDLDADFRIPELREAELDLLQLHVLRATREIDSPARRRGAPRSVRVGLAAAVEAAEITASGIAEGWSYEERRDAWDRWLARWSVRLAAVSGA